MSRMTDTAIREHKGDYGIDGSFHTVSARGQAIGVVAASAALAVSAAISLARGRWLTSAVTGTSAVGIAASAALYIYATRAGKFEVWNRILDDLRLQGDETVLDMGCGRGAVLRIETAEHAFKTPSLREVGRRAPYMHDGSLASLSAVVTHYAGGIVDRP